MEDKNDPPDEESDIEDDKIDSKEDLNIRNNENQISQVKPIITDI